MSRTKIILLFSDILLVGALVIVGAVAWASWADVSAGVMYILIGISCGLGVTFWPRREAIMGVCIVLGIAMGGWWIEGRLDISQYEVFVGEEYSGLVEVVGEPQEETYTQRVPVRAESPKQEGFDGISMWLRTQRWESYRVGDVVEVDCMLEVPEKGEDGTDWARIFRSRGPVLFCEDEDALATGIRNESWRSFFANIRDGAEHRLAENIPYPASALAEGLLFGGTSGLTQSWEEKFSQTSMTHIVAVSGYNVTLLVQYVGILAVAVGFRRQGSWWMSVVIIALFVALIGFPASGVRAGIMGALALLALSGGAMGSGVRALIMAAACMLVLNPFLLRYDVGFQLSLLATLGIILGMPLATKTGYHRWPIVVRIFFEIVATTLCAQIFVLPILLTTFGSFSVVSFLANIMILWTIPFAMILSLLVLLVSFISSFFASIIGMSVWVILSYVFFLIEYLSRSEVVIVFAGGYSFIFLFYYGILAIGFIWYAISEYVRLRQRCLSYGTRASQSNL